MDALEILVAGCKILDEVMIPRGFCFTDLSSGRSSGGYFATGRYVNGDRNLDLHFRHSLGLVTYQIGSLSISHEAYMRELLGRGGGNKYPGFSKKPLDAFDGLSHDLSSYCQDFLSGSGEEFKRCVEKAKSMKK